jgi:hypothetical protein
VVAENWWGLDLKALDEQLVASFSEVVNTKKKKGAKEDEEGSKSPVATVKKKVEKKIELIDAKRSYTVSISLASLGFSAGVVRDTVLDMDDEALPFEHLVALKALYVPLPTASRKNHGITRISL